MQKLSYFPAKDLKLPKDYSKSHVSIWVILHCFSSNFYVGWKISYSSLYFFCQIVMVCLWQFIAPQGALDIKQSWLTDLIFIFEVFGVRFIIKYCLILKFTFWFGAPSALLFRRQLWESISQKQPTIRKLFIFFLSIFHLTISLIYYYLKCTLREGENWKSSRPGENLSALIYLQFPKCIHSFSTAFSTF